MWKIFLFTSILVSTTHVLPAPNMKPIILGDNNVTALNSDTKFDSPNTLEIDFSDFNIEIEEVAESKQQANLYYDNVIS
jgi:hypothetical protein